MTHLRNAGPLLAAIVVLVSGLLLAAPLLSAEDTKPAGEMKIQATKTSEKAPPCQTCQLMQDRMKAMADVQKLLSEARTDAEARGAARAVGKIDQALGLIEKQHRAAQGMMDKGGCPMCAVRKGHAVKPTNPNDKGVEVVNSRCPIMGTDIGPDSVPKDLTRRFKGRMVGFCCPQCPPAWDRLSEEQKHRKLDKAMAKGEEPMGSGQGLLPHHGTHQDQHHGR